MSLNNASVSISNVQSISNTLNANPTSITSGVSSLASTSSTVGDPIAGVLNKTLSRIASVNSLTEKKINDLTGELDSYLSKNGSVSIVNNTIVITTTQQNSQQAQQEKQRLDSQISSIRNTLNVLQGSLLTLQSITSTINIIKGLLSVQQALLTINPISKATFSVLKKGIKILFLGDMMNSYSNLIYNQLAQNEAQLNQFLKRFSNLQVSINIQDNANQGNNISSDDAQSNIIQDLLNQNSNSNVDNQSDTFVGSNGRTYILTVTKYGDKQLVGKAIDQISGQLAVQTAPSYTESPDELLSELKSILNS